MLVVTNVHFTNFRRSFKFMRDVFAIFSNEETCLSLTTQSYTTLHFAIPSLQIASIKHYDVIIAYKIPIFFFYWFLLVYAIKTHSWSARQ